MDDKITLIIIYIIFLFNNRHNFFRIIYTCLLMINMYYLAKNRFNIKLNQWIIYIISYITSYYLIKDPNPFYYLFTFYLPLPNFFRGIFIIIFISYIFNKYIIILDIPKKSIVEENNIENNKEKNNIEDKDKEIKKKIIRNKNENNNKEIKEEINKEENNDNNKDTTIKEEVKEEDKNKDKESNNKKEKEEEIIKRYFLSKEIDYLFNNIGSLIWLFICLILLRIAIYFYEIKYWVYFEDNPFDDSKNPNKNKTMFYISAH